MRAVLEGTAFHLRRLVEARLVDQPSIGRGPIGGVACGGAARSELWMRLLVDVTGMALRVPEVVEAAVLGAAMLGGAAVGVLSLETAPARLVRIARSYHPDPASAERYDKLYLRYCGLDDLLLPWFHDGYVEDDAHADE